MRFAVFKGETNIKDLVSRLFGLSDENSPADMDHAANTLLQANPHLQDTSKLPLGSVIHVPPAAPPLSPGEEAPAVLLRRIAAGQQAQQIVALLDTRLSAIDARVADRANAFLTLAQTVEAQTIVQSSPELKAHLPTLVASLQTVATGTAAFQESRKQALSGVQTSLVFRPGQG